MKVNYTKGEKIRCTYFNGGINVTIHGVVESQLGTILKVRWAHKIYRPQDEAESIDYREVEYVPPESGSDNT